MTNDCLPAAHDNASLVLKKGMLVLVENNSTPTGLWKGKINGSGPSGSFPANVVELTSITSVRFWFFAKRQREPVVEALFVYE